MSQVTGVIEEIKGKGLFIGGTRYGAFDPSKQFSGAMVGDKVQFTYEKSGDWNNIKGNVRVEERGNGQQAGASTGNSPQQTPTVALPEHYTTSRGYLTLLKTFPVANDHPDRSIIRQSSNSVAASLVVPTLAKTSDPFEAADTVIKISRVLEQHATGELDDAEAKKALEELNRTN